MHFYALYIVSIIFCNIVFVYYEASMPCDGMFMGFDSINISFNALKTHFDISNTYFDNLNTYFDTLNTHFDSSKMYVVVKKNG